MHFTYDNDQLGPRPSIEQPDSFMRPYILLVAILLVVAGTIMFFGERAEWMLNEGAPIEAATVWVYAIGILLIIWKRPGEWITGNFLGAIVILFLLLRELDFNIAFTTEGIFKKRFYTSAEVPVMEKTIVIIILLLFFAVVFTLLKRYGPWLIKNVLSGHRSAWGIFTAFILAFVSKVMIDGLPRKLAEVGLQTPEVIEKYHGALEEVLELGIPISILLAIVYQAWPQAEITPVAIE